MPIDNWVIGGSVEIIPSLEFSKNYTFEELQHIAEDLKTHFREIGIHIYPKSTLISELNGPWNVTFSIQGSTVTGKRIEFFYMLRTDSYFKKSYGSPVDRPHSDGWFSLEYQPDLLDKIEGYLLQKLGGKRITEFPN